MKMKHCLTTVSATIVHKAETVIGKALLTGNLACHLEYMRHNCAVGAVQLKSRCYMGLRYNQYMNGSYRVQVIERRYKLVLINEVCRNFAVCYLTKNAI